MARLLSNTQEQRDVFSLTEWGFMAAFSNKRLRACTLGWLYYFPKQNMRLSSSSRTFSEDIYNTKN